MNPMMTELLAYERMKEREREVKEILRQQMILPKQKNHSQWRWMVHTVGGYLVRIGTQMQSPEKMEQSNIPIRDCC